MAPDEISTSSKAPDFLPIAVGIDRGELNHRDGERRALANPWYVKQITGTVTSVDSRATTAFPSAFA
jgi:hypothetical protein